MLGVNRRAATFTFTAALVILALYVVYLIRSTLFVFILAVLFAYLLTPLVDALDRVLPGRTRTAALALAYVIFLGVAGFAAYEIGSTVVTQASDLLKRLPHLLAAWENPAPSGPYSLDSIKNQILGTLRAQIAQGSNDLVGKLPQYGVRFLNIASYAIYLVIIPILAFFFLKDGRNVRAHVLEMIEAGPRRHLLDEIMVDIDLLLAHYMRALFGLSLAAFTAYGIFFSILGIQYSLLLAAIAAMLEFIPIVGPLTAAVIIVVVAAVSSTHVLAVLIFLSIYRVIQDYVIAPNLMGRGVELHPLLVLFGVFAGAEIAGIPGTFLSVPVLALVRILYLRLRKRRMASRLA
jgi:predicted PurR-regulated permease PerM